MGSTDNVLHVINIISFLCLCIIVEQMLGLFSECIVNTSIIVSGSSMTFQCSKDFI